MIVANESLDEEVCGSSFGDVFVASGWRGPECVAKEIALTAVSLAWDATRETVCQGRATFVVSDPDGSLSPWGMGDILAPGGSRIKLSWVSGVSGIRVPLGSWRIRSAEPSEFWRSYNNGAIRVSGGASISISAEEDITSTASICRIDGESPTPGASVINEIRKLLSEIGAVDTTLAPADKNIPGSYSAFPESRTDAVGDLLDMIGACSRVGGDGALQILPVIGIGPVWTIKGGDGGALISADRSLNDTGVYNTCTSKNTSNNGADPIVGRAYLTKGPLAWGGPYGKVPVFHSAIATSQPGVEQDAATYLANSIAAGTIDLAIVCLAHPALQIHDIVTILAPTVAGDIPLTGRVVSKSWGTSNGVPEKSMKLTVRVTAETLEMIAERARRG